MREGEARALEVGKDITAFSFKNFFKFYFFFTGLGLHHLQRVGATP